MRLRYGSGPRALKRIYLATLLVCGLLGCSESPNDSPVAPPPQITPPATIAAPTARQLTLRNRSCALCHVDGNAGAPRLGHRGDWEAIRAKSRATLLDSVVSGLNDMPPLGYCMACETADFEAIISMMLASGGGQ